MSDAGLNNSEIQELARVFCDPLAAGQLLDIAGLPRERHPNWQGLNSEGFWRQVNVLLGAGMIREGRRRVLEAAHDQFPGNPIFVVDSIDGAASDAGYPQNLDLGSRKRRGGVLARGRVRPAVAAGAVVAILVGNVAAVALRRGAWRRMPRS